MLVKLKSEKRERELTNSCTTFHKIKKFSHFVLHFSVSLRCHHTALVGTHKCILDKASMIIVIIVIVVLLSLLLL